MPSASEHGAQLLLDLLAPGRPLRPGGAVGLRVRRARGARLDRHRRRLRPGAARPFLEVERELRRDADLRAVERIGPEPEPRRRLVLDAEVEVALALQDAAPHLARVGVRGVLGLEAQPLGRAPLEAAEGGRRAAEVLVELGRAALAEVAWRALPEGRADVARRAEPPPAEAQRRAKPRHQPGRHRLGGDHVLARVNPGAEEVAQADGHGGHVAPLVQHPEREVEGAVVEGVEVVAEVLQPRVAEAAREPRQHLKRQRGAGLPGEGRDRGRKLGVGLAVGARHLHEAGGAEEVQGRRRLRQPRAGAGAQRRSRKEPRPGPPRGPAAAPCQGKFSRSRHARPSAQARRPAARRRPRGTGDGGADQDGIRAWATLTLPPCAPVCGPG